MTHRLATNYAKNYCNRTPIVKVIVENVVTCFFGGTQCIYDIISEQCYKPYSDQLSVGRVLSLLSCCDSLGQRHSRESTTNVVRQWQRPQRHSTRAAATNAKPDTVERRRRSVDQWRDTVVSYYECHQYRQQPDSICQWSLEQRYLPLYVLNHECA